MNAPDQLRPSLTRIAKISLAVGVCGGILCTVSAWMSPSRFYPAYLVAFLFWMGIALGSLAIRMLHHVTGGGWGVPIRRVLESSISTLPWMALLFLPIAFGMPHLYFWSDRIAGSAGATFEEKWGYLSDRSFLVRAATYFVIWTTCLAVLNRATATGRRELLKRREPGLAIFSGWGLVAWGLTVTFASIDWVMSLEPHWFSSMYGVLFMANQAVSALAWTIGVSILMRAQSPPSTRLNKARLHDLGNFLLAFVMFWTYIAFMQYLIVWSGNLPEESIWYLRRTRGGWQAVVGLLMTFHFLVPFLLLLARRVKRAARRMFAVALLLLAMRVVDIAWLVLPPFIPSLVGSGLSITPSGVTSEPSRFVDMWPLLFTIPGIGGLWMTIFARTLAGRASLDIVEENASQEENHGVEREFAH
jgi:hypothetical protein